MSSFEEVENAAVSLDGNQRRVVAAAAAERACRKVEAMGLDALMGDWAAFRELLAHIWNSLALSGRVRDEESIASARRLQGLVPDEDSYLEMNAVELVDAAAAVVWAAQAELDTRYFLWCIDRSIQAVEGLDSDVHLGEATTNEPASAEIQRVLDDVHDIVNAEQLGGFRVMVNKIQRRAEATNYTAAHDMPP